VTTTSRLPGTVNTTVCVPASNRILCGTQDRMTEVSMSLSRFLFNEIKEVIYFWL